MPITTGNVPKALQGGGMGKLNAAERERLPSSDFARPGKGSGEGGKGSGSFPIPDVSHARNALARAASKGPAVEAQVRAKVAHKFPGIGKHAHHPPARG